MSRRGDCHDNAVAESFFATVKKEEAERFPSYSDAKMALFDYIEVFYNQRRRYSRSRRGVRRHPRAIDRCSSDRRRPVMTTI